MATILLHFVRRGIFIFEVTFEIFLIIVIGARTNVVALGYASNGTGLLKRISTFDLMEWNSFDCN